MPRTFVVAPGKGPAKTEANTLTKGNVRIKQVRSGIGHLVPHACTLKAIGLRHHQDVVVKPDPPRFADRSSACVTSSRWRR